MSGKSEVSEARRLLLCGRAARAWALVEGMGLSSRVAEVRVHALTQLNRRTEAAAILAEAEALHGADDPWIAKARHKLLTAQGRTPVQSREYARALATIAELGAEPHENVIETRSEVTVCPRPGAKIVVVNFGLWMPVAAEDVLFADLGLSAVHVRGLQSRFRGDPDSIITAREQLAEELTAAARSTGAKWIVSIGASGQGMAAIAFAARREWDAAVAFSPISTLRPDVIAAFQGDRELNKILAPVMAATDKVAEVDALANLLNWPVETTVVYDPIHRWDSQHAERLAQAGCVRLEVLPGEGHMTGWTATADGVVPDLVKQTLKRAVAKGMAGRHRVPTT